MIILLVLANSSLKVVFCGQYFAASFYRSSIEESVTVRFAVKAQSDAAGEHRHLVCFVYFINLRRLNASHRSESQGFCTTEVSSNTPIERRTASKI